MASFWATATAVVLRSVVVGAGTLVVVVVEDVVVTATVVVVLGDVVVADGAVEATDALGCDACAVASPASALQPTSTSVARSAIAVLITTTSSVDPGNVEQPRSLAPQAALKRRGRDHSPTSSRAATATRSPALTASKTWTNFPSTYGLHRVETTCTGRTQRWRMTR